MTETTRTTVTLSKISMNQVKELVGVFGSTTASVISRIVEHFFDYGKKLRTYLGGLTRYHLTILLIFCKLIRN